MLRPTVEQLRPGQHAVPVIWRLTHNDEMFEMWQITAKCRVHLGIVPAPKSRRYDRGHGSRQPEHHAQLVLMEDRRDRIDHGADPFQSQGKDDKLVPVGELYRDDIAP